MPDIITQTIRRIAANGPSEWSWVWQWASQAERDTVDAWLVAIGHPLAIQAGTQESRFCAILRELSQPHNQELDR